MTPEERFAGLVHRLAAEPGVEPPTGVGSRAFGADALKVRGSIFAMLHGTELVVKLPAPRVAALIGDGTGTPFSAGRGTPMREWVTLPPDADWEGLAREALDYVGRKADKH